MFADGNDGIFIVFQYYLFASRQTSEAVPVGNHESTAVLDNLREVGIVHFTSDDDDFRAVFFLFVGFSGFEFFKRLFQFIDDEIFRAAVRRNRQNVEFVSRDAGIFFLSEFADFGDKAAHFVVKFHRFSMDSLEISTP